ncbi:MAG: tetratricopeptide repeat protein, partial [Nannocystaceae bacterium]
LQRDLSVSYIKLGDLHTALGNGQLALRYFEDSLAIAKELVDREPGRSDLQRDLSLSYDRLGDQHRALGNGELALRYFEDCLAIAKQLVDREPGRSDLQRDLSISYERLGDLHTALGNGQLALRYFEDALAIAKELVAREPNNYQAQSGLAQSFARMAAVEPEQASTWLDKSVLIQRRRLEQQPNNVITAVELAIVLFRLGQVHARAGQMEPAAEAFTEAHALFKTLEQKNALDVRYKHMLEWLNNAASGSGG